MKRKSCKRSKTSTWNCQPARWSSYAWKHSNSSVVCVRTSLKCSLPYLEYLSVSCESIALKALIIEWGRVKGHVEGLVEEFKGSHIVADMDHLVVWLSKMFFFFGTQLLKIFVVWLSKISFFCAKKIAQNICHSPSRPGRTPNGRSSLQTDYEPATKQEQICSKLADLTKQNRGH